MTIFLCVCCTQLYGCLKKLRETAVKKKSFQVTALLSYCQPGFKKIDVPQMLMLTQILKIMGKIFQLWVSSFVFASILKG